MNTSCIKCIRVVSTQEAQNEIFRRGKGLEHCFADIVRLLCAQPGLYIDRRGTNKGQYLVGFNYSSRVNNQCNIIIIFSPQRSWRRAELLTTFIRFRMGSFEVFSLSFGIEVCKVFSEAIARPDEAVELISLETNQQTARHYQAEQHYIFKPAT